MDGIKGETKADAAAVQALFADSPRQTADRTPMPPPKAQNLSQKQKQAALALLTHIITANGRLCSGLRAKLRRRWLQMRLSHEKLRLGGDNPSLFLHKQQQLYRLRQPRSAKSGAPPAIPPLSIRQWQRLLASLAKKL